MKYFHRIFTQPINSNHTFSAFTLCLKTFFLAFTLICLNSCSSAKKDTQSNEVLKQERTERFSGEFVPQIPHINMINALAYAHSAQFFISGSNDNTVKVWTPDTQLIRTIDVGFWVTGLSIFQNDKYALVNGQYNLAIVNLENGRLLRLPRISIGVQSVGLSPNNGFYAAGTNIGTVQIFDINGKQLAEAKLPAIKPTKRKRYGGLITPRNVTFLPNSLGVLTSNTFGELILFDLSGELISHMKIADAPITSISTHKSNKVLVTFGVQEFSLKGYENIPFQSMIMDFSPDSNQTIVFDSPALVQAKFSPDGSRIYGITQGVKTRDLVVFNSKGKQIRRFKIGRNSYGPTHLAVSQDGKQIVIANKKINPNNITVWSPEGNKVHSISHSLANINAVALHPKDLTIASGLGNGRLKFFSVFGKYVKSLWIGASINKVIFSEDGKKLIVSSSDAIQIWDYETKKRIQSIKSQYGGSNAIAITPNGNYLASGGGKGELRIFKLIGSKFKLQSTTKVGKFRIYALSVVNNGSAFALGMGRGDVELYNLKGKKMGFIESIKPMKNGKPIIRALDSCASDYHEGKKVLAVLGSAELNIYRLSGERVFHAPIGSNTNICSVKFVSDGRFVLMTESKNIVLFDWEKNQQVAVYRGHTSGVYALSYFEGTNLFLSGSGDGHLRIWNLNSGYSAAVIQQNSEWIVYDDNGFFDSSKNGGKVLHFSNGMNTFAVDQFALYFNRPDVIYSKLGIGSQEYIQHLKMQHKKRINKAFIHDKISAPELTPPKVNLLSKTRNGTKVELSIEIIGDPVELASYQIYLNNVPLFGKNGKLLKGKRATINESVELLTGTNVIEISAFNNQGSESFRVSTKEVNPRKKVGNLYFVGVGVSNYQMNEMNLKYAAKDVKDIANIISKQRRAFKTVHSKYFVNEQVTRDILSDISTFLSKATPDDSIILFFSGHGAYERDQLSDYYYLTHDATPSNIKDKAISWAAINDILYQLKANKKLVFIDTCESGEMEVAYQLRAFKIAKEKGFYSRANQILGDLKNSDRKRRDYLYQKDRYIYNDLVKGSGTIVFSSSAGGEMSYESQSLQNGFFTNAIIRALKNDRRKADKNRNGKIEIDELVDFVSIEVTKQTGGLQNPTVDRGNSKQTFYFH